MRYQTAPRPEPDRSLRQLPLERQKQALALERTRYLLEFLEHDPCVDESPRASLAGG